MSSLQAMSGVIVGLVSRITLIGTSVFTTLVATIALSRSSSHLGAKEKIIKSPAATLLPKLTPAETEALPYPTDALPGGRDVDSPYGTTRVFEWGPEDGRKVLLVHGITTPCLALGAVAHGLVERGCRVMLFDEWGRGYSDSPADLVHDERLYATQILIAVTSSPLSWTGGSSGGFSIVGYSLGGGISLNFTSYFPALVKSLVLVAPTGLIRESRLGFEAKMFSRLVRIVPESLLKPLLKKRLQRPIFSKENRDNVANAEITELESSAPKLAPASLKYPDITVLAATQWNIMAHAGFIRSFLSAVRYAPGSHEQAAWSRLASQKRKILIFVATHDPIVSPEDLKCDVEELLLGSESKAEWRVVEGAHDMTNTHPEKIAADICGFWGM